MSWLTGWTYRKAIVIAHTDDGAQTDYQLKLLVGESAGASGEQVDCAGHVLSSFDDLRFTTSDGETLCDYWIGSITGYTPNRLATVWVKVPSIAAHPADTTIYMYYGNAGAGAASSGADTFIAFDDFEDAGTYRDNWVDVVPGSPTITRDTAVCAVHEASMKIVDDSASYVEGALRDFSGRDRIRLCFRARVAQNNATARIGLFDTGGAHGLMTLRFNNAGNITAHNNLSLTTLQAYSVDTWYKFEILHDAASHLWSCCIDDVLKADGWNTYNNYTYQAVQHRCEFQTAAETGALYIDGWFVAKWTTNEPSWSSFGTEESEAPPPPPAYHVILSAVYSEEAPGVNRAFVVGTDAAGGQVSGSAITPADVDLVGERMDAHHNPAVPSGTVAAAVAAAQLARARLDGRRAELVIPPHCGLELWDVLAVIDTVANQDTLYRVTGYQLEYDTVKGTYLHRLQLCAV